MTSSVTYPVYTGYPMGGASRGGRRSQYAQPRTQQNGQQFFVTEDERCDCGRGLAEQLRKHRQQQKHSTRKNSLVEKKRLARKSSESSSRSKSVSARKPCTCLKARQEQKEKARVSRLSKNLGEIEKAAASYAYQGAEKLGRALSAGRETLAKPLNRLLGQERSASKSESEHSVSNSKSESKRKQKKTRFEESTRSQSDKKIPRVQTPGPKSSKSRVGQASNVKSSRAKPSLEKSSRSNSNSNSVSRSEGKRGRSSKRSVKEAKRVCSSCRQAKPASEFNTLPVSKSSGRVSGQRLVKPIASKSCLKNNRSSSIHRDACKLAERSSQSFKAQR